MHDAEAPTEARIDAPTEVPTDAPMKAPTDAPMKAPTEDAPEPSDSISPTIQNSPARSASSRRPNPQLISRHRFSRHRSRR